MFCKKCGAELKENANFCTKCGEKVLMQDVGSSTQELTTQNMYGQNVQSQENYQEQISGQNTYNNQQYYQEQKNGGGLKPKNKKAILFTILGILAVIIIAGIIITVYHFSKLSEFEENLSNGKKYMEEQNYDSAINAYNAALEYDSESEEAILNLSKAYLYKNNFSEAKKLLDSIKVDSSSENFEAYSQIDKLVNFNPNISNVDSSTFPNISVTLSQGSELVLTKDNVSVSEQGNDRGISHIESKGKETLITFTTEDSEISGENREFVLNIDVDGIKFDEQKSDYKTPYFERAQAYMFSNDVSQYPTVKVYFRITDNNDNPIENLNLNSFTIEEQLSGGKYLNREIKKAAPLKDNIGLNIDLVADKSDSISYNDMQKIKSVMTEFVRSLNYAAGDKAELLAFDSIVQQMCCYTKDVNLLTNGINNMSTDGLTAFYDAVYDGISHSALQGGARCVIAFTDGMDNVSRHSANDVISYANQKQVPVYIIGVSSSVDEYSLKNVANSTGGKYWFIDDLHDLREIFNQIYQEQKNLYEVEYISDSSLDRYLSRSIKVKVAGNGYRVAKELSFTPSRSINDNGGVDRSSRYKLIKESLSWEEASLRCQEMGGHLATITSQEEMDKIVALAKAEGVTYAWLGGYTSYDDYGNVFGHWVTGEPFNYQAWSKDEPSRIDKDGVEEWYIMLWNVPSLGGWTWNDERNDPASVITSMKSKMSFICEFEN